MTRQQAKGYLGAMIDGEGCVKFYGDQRQIVVTNKVPDLMRSTGAACAALGIEYTVRRESSGIFKLTISGRDNLERCLRLALIQHPEKAAKLAAAVGSYKLTKEHCRNQSIGRAHRVGALRVAIQS